MIIPLPLRLRLKCFRPTLVRLSDCSLPDIAFLCPESSCAKNQRNGPCGGTRDGKCEVHDFECIWARAYDRLKYEGDEMGLLDHSPVIQDQALRGTSAWGNTFLQRDHHSNPLQRTDKNEHGDVAPNTTQTRKPIKTAEKV